LRAREDALGGGWSAIGAVAAAGFTVVSRRGSQTFLKDVIDVTILAGRSLPLPPAE